MSENGKYRILQGCYWMLINVVFGYIVFYLSEYGYSAGEIGTLSAAFAALSAICQPVLGRIADKNSRFGWKPQILVFSLSACVLFGILFIVKHPIIVGLLFGVVMLFVNCIQPMLNAACFYYVKRGIPVDFGIARGVGSLAYAVMASVLGFLTVRLGTNAILFAGIPVLLIQFMVVLRMPYENSGINEKKGIIPDSDKMKKNSASRAGFVKKYPIFCLMILGNIILITVHHFMSTYLLQIIEFAGGDSSHMGIALSIGALTEIPMLFLFTHIVKRIPASTLIVFSSFAYFGKSLMFFFAGNVWMVYAANLLQPFSYALYASASIYFANECMQEEDKVTGQSLMTMTMSVGSLIGNLIGGWLIDLSGVKLMMTFSNILAVIATVVVIISAVLYRRKIRIIA